MPLPPFIDRKEIGRRLKDLRRDAFGEDQKYADFEEASGVSRGSIKPIEDGKSYPMFDVLVKWIYGCGRTLTRFSQDLESKEKQTEEAKLAAEMDSFVKILIRTGDKERLQSAHSNLKDVARAAVAEQMTKKRRSNRHPHSSKIETATG